MKRFLLAFFSCFVLAFTLVATLCVGRVSTAHADEPPTTGTYACVVAEHAYFYSTPDESNGVFLLPTTYYVRLLDYGDAFCRVEYYYDGSSAQKLTGYAKTSALAFVDYVPATPYFYYTFEMRYSINGEPVGGEFLDEIKATCTYYGDYNVGSKTYCYVLRGDVFGYVPKPADLRVKKNPEYETYLAEQESQLPVESVDDESEHTPSSSPAQIAILVALCLLIPVLATLILRPQKRRRFEMDD